MVMDIGPQYKFDDPFKAEARLHQSNYRARVLQVGYLEYGNRLTEVTGRAVLNYYEGVLAQPLEKVQFKLITRGRDSKIKI